MLDQKKILDIFKVSPTPTLILKANKPLYTILEVNNAFLKATGITEKNLIGTKLFEVFSLNTDDRYLYGNENVKNSLETVLTTKISHKTDLQKSDAFLQDTATKTERYWSTENTPVLNEQEEVEFIIHTLRDVTEHILDRRENRLLFNNTNESIILIDSELNIINFNSQFAENYKNLFNIEVQKYDSILSYVQTQSREALKKMYQRVIWEGEIIEDELIVPSDSGKNRTFYAKYKPATNLDGSIYGAFVSLSEITAEKEAQTKLEINEKRYRALVENGSDVVIILSPEGSPVYASPSVTNVLGYSIEETLALNITSVVHPDDVQNIQKTLAKVLQSPGIPIHGAPSRMRHKDGTWRWFEATVTNMLHDPAIGGIVDNFREITEKMEAERKLSEAKKQYQSLIQTIDGIVWESKADTFEFTYVSPQVEKILGHTQKEWTKTQNFWSNHIHPDDRKEAVEYCQYQTILGNNHTFEYRMQKHDGSYVWLRDVVTVIQRKGKPDVLRGLMIDITEQKKAEEARAFERRDKEALINSTEDLIWSIDRSLNLIAGNKAILAEIKNKLNIALKAGDSILLGLENHPEYIKQWKDFYQRALSGESFRIETNKSYPDFLSSNWYETSFNPIYDGDKVAGVACFSRNITESKKTQQQLKDAEQKLRNIVEHSTNMFYQHTVDHVLTYVSPQSINFLGYKPDETNREWTDFITDHPINIKGLKSTELAIKTGETQPPYELELEKLNGEIIWVEVNEAPLVKEGKTAAIIGSLTDITERKVYEEKLKESIERYEYASLATKDAIYDWDIRKDYLHWAEGYKTLFGHILEEPNDPYKSWDVFIHPEDYPEIERSLNKALKSPNQSSWIVEYRFQKADGSYSYVWENGFIIRDADGEPTRMIGAIRDISERREYEKFIEESNERYNIVSKATSDTIWDLDFEKDLMEYNSNIYTMFGYKKTEVYNLKKWWKDKIHPEDRAKVEKTLNEVLKNKTERFQIEYRFLAANGDYKNIYDRAYLIKDKSGKPIRMIGAMQDVTQNMQEQERLKLLESVITNTSESVLITEARPTHPQGRKILYVNEAFTKMTGYSMEESLGQTFSFLYGPDTDKYELVRLRDTLNNFEATKAELLNYKKNGEEFWCNLSVVPVKDKTGDYSHWVFIGRNVTEQKNKEYEIRESLNEKEILLSEIHHRVKNNLAVVSGMMQLQAFDENNEALSTKLFDSVARIKTMATVHELLYKSQNFSKLDFSQNLNKLATSITETFQAQTIIELKFDCNPVDLNINQAIPASLIVNEIITNIHKHAFKNQEKGTIKLHLTEEKNTITLTISDDGVGLPNEFDPHNTHTLGLHLIEVLAQQLEGRYKYQNNFPGTSFMIEFKKSDTQSGVGNASMRNN